MAALVRFPPLPSREMTVSCWLPGIPALNAALVHLSRGVPALSSLLKARNFFSSGSQPGNHLEIIT